MRGVMVDAAKVKFTSGNTVPWGPEAFPREVCTRGTPHYFRFPFRAI